LILWTSRQATRATVPAAVLSFGASLAVFALSWFEHNRAIRPSTLLNLYLLFSLVFDAVQVRTLYLRHDDAAILGLFTASISIKTVLLLLEVRSKRGYLKAPYNRFSPETTGGIFNHSFFWWLSPVLTTGFKKILTVNDLSTTDPELLSESLQNQMQSSWNKCRRLCPIVVNADSLQMRPPANLPWFMPYSTVSDGLWRR
jgi:ATP-binding cassette subfamily C (CFTR/MRP) protein 1